jgi:hypothetical protein
MKIDDVKALWAIRRHAADDAAQQLTEADAQRARADSTLVAFRAQVANEMQRAQGLGLSRTLALWYAAAARRLHDLEAMAVRRAGEAAVAREALRSTMTEAERIGTVSRQLETQRRIRIARLAQGQMDKLALRRRSR